MGAIAKRCVDCVREGINTIRKAPHPGPRCASHNRVKRAERRSTAQERRWLAVYGLSADEYNTIKEFQGGVCPLCQRANGARKALSVDHDHATGIVRGCLCTTDNKLLGHARDQIEFFERCIDYLKNPPAVQVIGEHITPDVALTLNGDP